VLWLGEGHLIGSESSCDLGSETYKLSVSSCIYNYNNYILNLVGRYLILNLGVNFQGIHIFPLEDGCTTETYSG
jgi:hypothetical protein